MSEGFLSVCPVSGFGLPVRKKVYTCPVCVLAVSELSVLRGERGDGSRPAVLAIQLAGLFVRRP